MSGSGAPAGLAAPALWPGRDGEPVACREKLKVLAENHEEAVQVLTDLLEDAVLMGVDEAAMRRILAEMVAALPSPRRASGRQTGGEQPGGAG